MSNDNFLSIIFKNAEFSPFFNFNDPDPREQTLPVPAEVEVQAVEHFLDIINEREFHVALVNNDVMLLEGARVDVEIDAILSETLLDGTLYRVPYNFRVMMSVSSRFFLVVFYKNIEQEVQVEYFQYKSLRRSNAGVLDLHPENCGSSSHANGFILVVACRKTGIA